MLAIIVEADGFPSASFRPSIYVGDNATVTVTGNSKLMKTWKVSSNLKEQKEHNRFIENSSDNWDKIQLLAIENLDLRKRIDQTPEKSDSLYKSISYLRTISDSVYSYIAQEDYKILEQTPVTEVWIDHFSDLARNKSWRNIDNISTEQIEKLYKRMTPEQLQTETGQWLTAQLYPSEQAEETVLVAKIGDPMPDADFVDLNGNTYRLADFKGKYILLDFWYRGCSPCLAAIPEMREVAQEYKDRMVIVSITEDAEGTWRRASQEHNITWMNLREKDQSNISLLYGESARPFYVIISPEGAILGKWLGYGSGRIRSKVKEYI